MTISKVLHFALGPLLSALISLILIPVMAWVFPIEDIGRYSLLQTILTFAALIMTFGLDQAYVREFHEVRSKSVLLLECLLPGLILLFVTASLAWYFHYIELLSSNLFEYESVLLSYSIIICVLLMYVSRFFGLVLRMQERGLAYSFSQLMPKLAFLTMLAIMFFFCGRLDFEDLVMCYSVSMVLVAIILAVNVRDEFREICVKVLNLYHLKYMLKYATPLLVSNIFFWALISMDKMFIQHLSSLEEVGLYSMASNFAGAALIFQLIFSTIWTPVVYRWASEGLDVRKLNKIVGYVGLVVCFVWVGVGLFSTYLTYVLPVEYSNVQFLIIAVISHPLLYLLSEASSVGIGIKRKSYLALCTSIIAVATNAAFNILLVPLHGAAGAASALAISFFTYFVIRTELSRYVFGGIGMIKIYIAIAALVSFAIYVNIVPLSISVRSYFYLSALFVFTFIFRADLLNLLGDLKFIIRQNYGEGNN